MTPITHELLDGVPHGFFPREGGVSTGLYAGLNCGAGSDDDPAAVAENRRCVAAFFGKGPEALRTLHQVHGTRAITPDAAPPPSPPRADGQVTGDPALVIGALAADCAPVLFADRAARLVGAAHAGWRGALDGILEATVDALVAAGADRARVVAVVGPCISQRAYEVGEEFLERFVDEDPEHARFFAGGPAGKPMFDLPGFCLWRLRAAGVAEAAWTGHCTYGDEARFYSYRRATHRGEPDYGRLIGAIAAPG
jgi:YfiH family protein